MEQILHSLAAFFRTAAALSNPEPVGEKVIGPRGLRVRRVGAGFHHERTIMAIKHLLLGILVTAIWGANFTVIQLGLAEVDPFALACARFA
jgi:hypothetical protein